MDIFGFDIPIWFLLLSGLVVLVCMDWRKQRRILSAFDEQGISGPAFFPFFGNIISFFRDPWHCDLANYLKFGRPAAYRMFMQGHANLVVFNRDLVKQVLVKDFSFFTNKPIMSDLLPPPTEKMLIVLRDDEWRNVRAHLSPTFSGIKMRRMVNLINDCGRNLVQSLETPARAGDDVDLHEFAKRYTLDSIARVAFGLDFDCYGEENIFMKNVKDMLYVPFMNPLFWIVMSFPKSGNFFRKVGFSIFPESPLKFFTNVIDRAIGDRKASDEVSSADFLQLMIEGNEKFEKEQSAEDSPHRGLTKDEILAQCMIFLIAGNSTVSSIFYLTLFCLAKNQEEQEKAYQEAHKLLQEDGFNYDTQKKLKYIEMCMEETMRLYPPAPRVDRQCAQDITIAGINIPKDTIIQIPISAFHHDPDLWDDPAKFNPERFSPESKASFSPFQYMPFGGGPRICVAQRLAMAEVKIGIAYVLQKYKLVTTEKSKIPLNVNLRLEPKNGAWVKFEIRE